MALTVEQQAQVDIANAMEDTRHTYQLAILAKQAKLEAIRIAQQTLIENARSKAVEDRDISAADITAYAEILIAYNNA